MDKMCCTKCGGKLVKVITKEEYGKVVDYVCEKCGEFASLSPLALELWNALVGVVRAPRV